MVATDDCEVIDDVTQSYHVPPSAANSDATIFESNTSIPAFFAGRDIFITGGTGFMGKVLIEKLLRSCPNLKRIFVLIRPKKQSTATARIEELKKLPVFDRLRIEQPANLMKMIAVEGDVCQLGLGLSQQSRDLMRSVSMVFHSAASVRFDDPLHQAVLMNTRGTREMMLFAETLPLLTVFVHVSTTYCNPAIRVINEKVYPPNADWQTTIRLAEEQPDILDMLTLKYTNYEPNTYTFTKGLAEQVANDFRDRLPVIIYRPSIVICAMEEPIPGWVDNFNGPIGLLIACGIGIMRTSHADPDTVSDFTPVDTSIKAMIVAAWDRSVNSKSQSLQVYNCSTSLQRKFTTGFIVQMGEELAKSIPFDKMLWKPGGCITRCKYNNFIKFLIFHLMTAYLVDFVYRIIGQKPFLVKLQRRIYTANFALRLFMTTSWTFENDEFLKLHGRIPTDDVKTFRYDNFVTADVREYLQNCVIGARRYLLNEPDENIPKARRNYLRFWYLDATIKTLVYGAIGYYTLIFLQFI